MAIGAFTHLTANVKDHISCGLAPCTAVVGPARSYKTAVLDAVRLALTGKHTKLSNPVDLEKLRAAVDRVAGLPMQVSLQGPHGFAEWTLPMEGGVAKKPSAPRFTSKLGDLVPEAERERIMPVAPVKDLLTGESKGREATIARFGQNVTMEAPPGLTVVEKVGWEEGVVGVRGEMVGASAAEVLAGLESWFRREKLAAGRDRDAMGKTIEAQKAKLAGAGGVEVLDTLKKQLGQAVAYEAVAPKRERLRALAGEQQAMGVRVATYEKDVATFEARKKLAGSMEVGKQRELLVVGRWLLDAIKKAIGKGNVDCPCCKQTWDIKKATDREAEVATMVATRAASVAAAGGGLESEERGLMARRHELAKEKARVDSAMVEVGAVVKAMSDAPATWKGPDSGTLRAQIAGLEGLGKLRDRLDSDVELRAKHESRVTLMKGLEGKAADRLREKLVEVKAEAESVVNRYMPAGYKAVLALDGRTAQWSVVGEDGVAHEQGVMCGSEMGTLMVALGIAWTEGAPLRVMLLDDPDLGLLAADCVPAVLRVVEGAVRSGVLTQAIVALSRAGEVPDGWTTLSR